MVVGKDGGWDGGLFLTVVLTCLVAQRCCKTLSDILGPDEGWTKTFSRRAGQVLSLKSIHKRSFNYQPRADWGFPIRRLDVEARMGGDGWGH